MSSARYVGRFGSVTASAYDEDSLLVAYERIDRSYEFATRGC